MRVRVDLRPVPAIRLRLGRAILHIRVLRDRPAIHVKTPRYLRARHSLPVESPDILHNGHRYRHVPFLPERRPAATGRIKTDWQLGNIQAAAPMPITSPGNDDDTGENHQPTLRKNTAEPVEQTLKQNRRLPPPEGSQKLAWLWGRSTLASAMHYFTPKRCATSNKIMYHDKAQVQRAADQSLIERGVELWVYRCEFCGCWHLTHRDPQSSYRHVPLNQQLKPHSRKKGYKPRRR